MAESSRFWDGLSTGDATEAPYDAASEFADVLGSLSRANTQANIGGVVRGARSRTGGTLFADLLVSGTSSPVSVGSGRAFVKGTWYENSATVTKTIATPVTSTRIDRVILRKSWAAQTVRIAVLTGTEGGSEPALTQTYGTTWEIPLAKVSITTGGVITVTDEREFIGSGVIYSDTLIAAAASIDITGIPAFYDHLELVLRARSDVGSGDRDTCQVRFNNSAAAIYDFVQQGYGPPSFTEGGTFGQTVIQAASFPRSSYAANVFGIITMRFPYYARTDTFKYLESRCGWVDTSSVSGHEGIYLTHGQWRSTAAINRITLFPSGGNFDVGTTVQLRGVPA